MNFAERAIERKYVMSFLKAHWPAFASVMGLGYSFLKPSIDAYVVAHPHTAVSVFLTTAVAAWYANQKKIPGGTQ